MYLATILKFALPATAMITAVTVGVTYYNAAEVPPLPAIAAPAVPEMPAPVTVACLVTVGESNVTVSPTAAGVMAAGTDASGRCVVTSAVEKRSS